MKCFFKKFITVWLLVMSNLSLPVMAESISTDIFITKSNNLVETGINGYVVDNYKMSDDFILQNEIDKSDIKENCYDSIIIPYGTENKKSTKTEKVVYDTIEWTEIVKANIKMGESYINGDKGRSTFNTTTYIQADTKSSMFPVEAVSYLMGNLSIGEVKTKFNKTGSSVTIDYDGKKIEFTTGSDRVIVNDQVKDIDNGAFCEFKDGKLFIPLRSFSNAIDCKIDWIADNKIVNLEKTFSRKSKVKRIETIETPIETIDKTRKCTCPSYCTCNFAPTPITSIYNNPKSNKSNLIISEQQNYITYINALCEHCKKCDVCNKYTFCTCERSTIRPVINSRLKL